MDRKQKLSTLTRKGSIVKYKNTEIQVKFKTKIPFTNGNSKNQNTLSEWVINTHDFFCLYLTYFSSTTLH